MSDAAKWTHNVNTVRSLEEMSLEVLESIVDSNKMTDEAYRAAKHEALLRFVGSEVEA